MSVQEQIQLQLQQVFQPHYLEVINESHGHNVAAGSETHFKLVLVSEAFEGQRSVARHRQVYSCLAEFMAAGVHALALHTYTASEWEAKKVAPESPPCLGGSKG